jgi:hypothetical protein
MAKNAGQAVDRRPRGRIRRVAIDVAHNADAAVPEQVSHGLDVASERFGGLALGTT